MNLASLTSSMKAALFYYAYRNYDKLLMLDEVPNHVGQTDLLVVTKKYLTIDIEIKASLSDLKKDAKKQKHEHWQMPYWQESGHIPNYFIFVIPASIEEKALPFIKEKWPFAGVLVWHDRRRSTDMMTVARKMKRVHSYTLPQERREWLIGLQAQRYSWNQYIRLSMITRNARIGR